MKWKKKKETKKSDISFQSKAHVHATGLQLYTRQRGDKGTKSVQKQPGRNTSFPFSSPLLLLRLLPLSSRNFSYRTRQVRALPMRIKRWHSNPYTKSKDREKKKKQASPASKKGHLRASLLTKRKKRERSNMHTNADSPPLLPLRSLSHAPPPA